MLSMLQITSEWGAFFFFPLKLWQQRRPLWSLFPTRIMNFILFNTGKKIYKNKKNKKFKKPSRVLKTSIRRRWNKTSGRGGRAGLLLWHSERKIILRLRRDQRAMTGPSLALPTHNAERLKMPFLSQHALAVKKEKKRNLKKEKHCKTS